MLKCTHHSTEIQSTGTLQIDFWRANATLLFLLCQVYGEGSFYNVLNWKVSFYSMVPSLNFVHVGEIWGNNNGMSAKQKSNTNIKKLYDLIEKNNRHIDLLTRYSIFNSIELFSVIITDHW